MCRKPYCRCWSFCINGQFLWEYYIYTVLAYSFSFVLLTAVTSQLFLFHLSDSSFSTVPTELIWEQDRSKEERQFRKEPSCEKVQKHNLKIWFKLSPWLIFGSFLSSSLIISPPACGLGTSNTTSLDSASFLFITHRLSWWVSSAPLTWKKKVTWIATCHHQRLLILVIVSLLTHERHITFPRPHSRRKPVLQLFVVLLDKNQINWIKIRYIRLKKKKSEKDILFYNDFPDFYLIMLFLLW